MSQASLSLSLIRSVHPGFCAFVYVDVVAAANEVSGLQAARTLSGAAMLASCSAVALIR